MHIGRVFVGLASFLRLDLVQNPITDQATYTNPISNVVGAADPWVTRYGDYYYLMFTNGVNLTLSRSHGLTYATVPRLPAMNTDSLTVIGIMPSLSSFLFKPPPSMTYSTDLWAPEIHNINGKWYVIFTADSASGSPPADVAMFGEFDCLSVNHRYVSCLLWLLNSISLE